MEFGKKKRGRGEKRFKNTLKQILKKRWRIIEYSLTLLLLIVGFFTYLSFQKRKEAVLPLRPELLDKSFREGVYHYRLENYDRSELLFKSVLEHSRKKKIKSFAALYLGNICFREEEYDDSEKFYLEAHELYKKNFYALYNAAIASSKKGSWGDALSYAQKAYSINDEYTKNRLFLANFYYGTGRFDKARSLYEVNKADLVAGYNLAMLCKRENDEVRSRLLLENIAANSCTSEVLRGICYYTLAYIEQRDQRHKTLEHLRKGNSIFPSDLVMRFNLALYLMKENQYREAADLLKSIQGMASFIDEKGYYTLFGQALFNSGNYGEALEFFSQLYNETGCEWIAYIIGDIQLALGNSEQAVTYYRKALSDPSNEGAYINLAYIYMNEGSFASALEVCVDYKEHSSRNPRPSMCIADVYFLTGDIGLAKDTMKKALELIGDDPSGLDSAAGIYKKHAMYDNALQLYSKIRSIEPAYPGIQEKIAALYLNTGHDERAERIWSHIRSVTPDPDRYYRASLMLAQLVSEERAILLYSELADDFPYRYEAYYNRALLHINAGEYKEALSTVKECIYKIPGIDHSSLAKLYSVSGVAYLLLGNFNEASRAFHTAHELDRENEIPLLNLKITSELMQQSGL